MRTVFFLVSTGALILAIAATPVAAAPSPSALCASTKWKGAGQQAKAQSSCEARAIASSVYSVICVSSVITSGPPASASRMPCGP